MLRISKQSGSDPPAVQRFGVDNLAYAEAEPHYSAPHWCYRLEDSSFFVCGSDREIQDTTKEASFPLMLTKLHMMHHFKAGASQDALCRHRLQNYTTQSAGAVFELTAIVILIGFWSFLASWIEFVPIAEAAKI